MALISCPSCDKKVSSKATRCNHCSFDLTDMDEEKLSRLNRQKIIKTSQRIHVYSTLGLIMFLAATWLILFKQPAEDTPIYYGGMAMGGIGILLYIASRIWMVMLKRSS